MANITVNNRQQDQSVDFPAVNTPYWQTVNAIWPDLANGKVAVAPPRNGMDRFTGKIKQSFPHVEQSMEIMFATPFHQRVLRRWVGTFVPHLLGESAVERIVTRFFWAIATSLDLWEPDYRIRQVHVMGDALQRWAPQTTVSTADLYRQGEFIFRTEGQWYPRGHLGNFTPYILKSSGIVSDGGLWSVVPVSSP